MQSGNFFEWLGGMLGSVIRAIAGGLSFVVGGLGHAVRNFTDGFAGALGIHASSLNMILVVIGLLFLVAGIRSLLQRSFIGGIFWLVLAALLLGRLIP